MDDLPAPARRWLAQVLPAGVPLAPGVVLEMTGLIKIGPKWWPFTAEQVLRAGIGFLWRPLVGGRLTRIVGADVLTPSGGRMEFWLHARIPLVRADGPDVERSAAGRLAAETVAWLPEAASPQSGARWSAVDDERATVSIGGPAGPIDIDVQVSPSGELVSVGLTRWNGGVTPPGPRPFGGTLRGTLATATGVRIARSGSIGWGFGEATWPKGEFFRFQVRRAQPIARRDTSGGAR